MTRVLDVNAEAQAAWDGVLFDRFVQYRHLVVAGIAPHGEEAIRRYPPPSGSRVLDIGCGFGDSTQLLAELVGPAGCALGVDIAPRFVAGAREEAAQAGTTNARFEVMDVQAAAFDETFDYAFSRFGTMFFDNPVPALRNVRRALAPGSLLCIVVWRQKPDNPWLYRAEGVVKPLVEIPDETDEPRCGPGPFSMAGADTTSGILLAAGYERIGFERLDLPLRIGRTMEEAIDLNLALGPAAEAVRLAGEEGERLRPRLAKELRGALAEYETDAGVVAPSSTWIVTARVPAS